MLPISTLKHLKTEVAEVVRLWNDPKWNNVARKRWEALGTDGIGELIAQVETQAKQRKRFLRRWITISLSTIITLCLFGVFAIFCFPKDNWFRWWHSPIIGIANLIAFVVMLIWMPRVKAAKVLAEQDDLRIIGALATAWGNSESGDEIAKALIRLLPQIKQSDVQILYKEQREALYQILTPSTSTEEALIIAILKSLEQIGDGGALPYVEKLLNPKAKVSEKVQEAARSCLPFLTEWATEEQNRSTLLRASGENIASSTELLRPTIPTPSETDPGTLLRASQQH